MKKDKFDISIEEFDSPCEVHEFSDKYKKEKELNMKNFKRENRKVTPLAPKIAAAATVLAVASPFVVNAATNGEFFARVWGKDGRENIPYHTEEYYEDGKDTAIVAYPQQEFVDVDESQAEELVGDNIEHLNIVKEVDGTTITILNAVRDERSAIVEFTLEKDGGIDFLGYSQIDNEAKGAWFNDDATFTFSIGKFGGKIYVDLQKSTEDKLYCYYYLNEDGALWLTIDELPCTVGERSQYSRENNNEELDRIASEVQTSTVRIPCENYVDSVEFTNADGGVISISSMSMSIDMKVGLGLDSAEAGDSYSVHSVSINYTNGDTYVVEEHSNYKYTTDVEIANYSYSSSDLAKNLRIVFNRLVDVSDISSITVNGVDYTRSENTSGTVTTPVSEPANVTSPSET